MLWVLCLTLLLSATARAGLPSPELVKDILPGTSGSVPDFSRPLVVGTQLLFAARDFGNDYELWRSDGTAAGTVRVKDIRPGSLGSEPSLPMGAGGSIYFSARDSSSRRGLWKSDGTTAGTVLVKDIRIGSDSSPIRTLGTAGTVLYFQAATQAEGVELWKSDGTAAGTTLVADITPGTSSSSFTPGVGIGSIYYFVAKHPTLGSELWRTDGTPSGTRVVKDIAPASVTAAPSSLCAAGGILYFVADDGVHGSELWRTDGTEAGTRMVQDIASGSTGGTSPARIDAAGSLVFFHARSSGGPADWEIWRSDGTSGGTFPLLAVGSLGTQPMHATGNRIYFYAAGAGGAYQIWKSDGTVAGTSPLKPGMTSRMDFLLSAGSTFYFGKSPVGELWQSDGTADGTRVVADLTADSSLYHNGLNRPVLLGDRIIFDASDTSGNQELYAYEIAAPSISRPEIRARTKTAATIDLGIHPNGRTATASLEYGPTELYGQTRVIPVSATEIGGFQSFSLTLADLAPATMYRYRVTATSSAGSRVATGSFETVYTREDWRLSRFGSVTNSGDADDNADPDSDGLPNLVEYAFGLDPHRSDAAALPTGRMTYSHFIHEFTRPTGIEDVSYGVEWSATLEAGSWQAAANTGTGAFLQFKVASSGRPRLFTRWTAQPR